MHNQSGYIHQKKISHHGNKPDKPQEGILSDDFHNTAKQRRDTTDNHFRNATSKGDLIPTYPTSALNPGYRRQG